MPRKRLSMTKIEEVLRLTYEQGCSRRAVGRAYGVTQSTVSKLLRRARKMGLSWPLPEGMDEAELQEQLYGRRARRKGKRQGGEPDFGVPSQMTHLSLQNRS